MTTTTRALPGWVREHRALAQRNTAPGESLARAYAALTERVTWEQSAIVAGMESDQLWRHFRINMGHDDSETVAAARQIVYRLRFRVAL